MSEKLYRITYQLPQCRADIDGFHCGEIHTETELSRYTPQELGRELVGEGPPDFAEAKTDSELIEQCKGLRNWVNGPVAQLLEWGKRTVVVGGMFSPNTGHEVRTESGGVAAASLILPLLRKLVDAATNLGCWLESVPPAWLSKGDALILLNKIKACTARAIVGTPEANSEGKQPNVEQEMERVALAVGDDNAARILAIAQRKDWKGERKMEEILRLDNRFASKDSGEWADLIGVSAAAVRSYRTWKALQQVNKGDD
jgi:hypothetical protein